MKKILILLIYLEILCQVNAQNIILSKIPTQNQLPVGDIVCMLQDSEGYMWYGTSKGGLYRDDGYTIKAFRSDSNTPNLLESNSITCITEDKQQQIWFGTRRGLYVINKKDYQVRPLADQEIKSWVINTVYATSDGTIWVAAGNTLFRYNSDGEKKGTYVINKEREPHNIYEGNDNSIWVILWKGGILKYNEKQDCFIPYPWRFKENPTCILKDASSPYYWIGTWGKGVVRFDPNEKDPDKMYVPQTITTSRNGVQSKRISSIAQDSIRHLIWTTAMDDLYVYEVTAENNLYPIQTSDFLPPEKKIIHNIKSDRAGNMWVSSYYPYSFILSFQPDGISRYSMPKVKKETGIPIAPYILAYENGYYWFWQIRLDLCLYQPADDNLLIPNSNELLAFFEKSKSKDGILAVKQDSIVVLIQNKNGRIAESKVCVLPVKQHERIRTLHEDLLGNIWIGTTYSLIKYDLKTSTFHEAWKNTGIVNRIASSTNGDIFIATESNGLLKLTVNGEKNQYNPQEGDNFLTLSVSPDNNVWVTSQQSRVYCYNAKNDTFDRKTFEYDLNGEIICDAITDNQGNLWILSEQKIVIYDIEKQTFRLIHCTDPSIHLDNFLAIYKDEEGKIHIGGTGGILMISSNSDSRKQANDPFIHLTDIKINGVPRTPNHNKKEIILQSDERNLELFFSTFDFINRDKIRFAFRIKGQNSNWNYLPEGQNNIYLAELSKGKYELELKATNKNGSWSEKTASILIQRLPAWYESWFAYTLYILIISLTACFTIWKYIQYQKKKQQIQMKEEISQIKYRFFTNISHELRTPLTLIITPLEAIIKKISDEVIRQQLESVSRNAQNLLSLVNQLLDFRKIEMNGEQLFLTNDDIDHFLASICENFQLMASEGNISLKYNSALSSYYIFFDHNKLQKIVNNLLSNALKFTNKNDRVTLTLREEMREGRVYVVISVEDTGKGIPMNELSHIFERFHQVNTEEGQIGSGIGLHLVKEYTNMHQGDVAVQSEVGKGSIFSIYIPTDLKPDERQKEITLNENSTNSPVNEPDSQKKKILIVEDNKEFRTYMGDELRRYYTVVEASNGREGEIYALEQQPDIIITDLMMPEMNGIELCHRIKNNINISHIPVILLTANDNIENEKKGYKERVDAYIVKPFHWDILLFRIQNLMEQKVQRHKTFEKELKVSASNITISSLDERFLKKILDLVEKNMSNSEYSIEDLSSDMAMSRANLYRKINSITGNTPTDFVKNIRLKRAAELIIQGELTITEVAYKVGFSTPSHFSQSFKRMFGVVPTNYASEATTRKFDTANDIKIQ